MTPDGRPFTRNSSVYIPVKEIIKINKNTRRNSMILFGFVMIMLINCKCLIR